MPYNYYQILYIQHHILHQLSARMPLDAFHRQFSCVVSSVCTICVIEVKQHI